MTEAESMSISLAVAVGDKEEGVNSIEQVGDGIFI
jgi:hypothetical protein